MSGPGPFPQALLAENLLATTDAVRIEASEWHDLYLSRLQSDT